MPHQEHHYTQRSPFIRAAVLGANDGIISMAGVLMAVAAAGASIEHIILTCGSALVAGALSMGAGEYISVYSQLDSEKADIEREKSALAEAPEAELEELISNYESKGLSRDLATKVAHQLTQKDALRSHLHEELGIEPTQLSQPKTAALISFLSFTLGGGIPALIPILLDVDSILTATIPVTLACLAVLGFTSSKLGGVAPLKGVTRVVLMGVVVLFISHYIGEEFLQEILL